MNDDSRGGGVSGGTGQGLPADPGPRICAWCSAPAGPGDTKCPACGAALAQSETIDGVGIPGVTTVDPALSGDLALSGERDVLERLTHLQMTPVPVSVLSALPFNSEIAALLAAAVFAPQVVDGIEAAAGLSGGGPSLAEHAVEMPEESVAGEAEHGLGQAGVAAPATPRHDPPVALPRPADGEATDVRSSEPSPPATDPPTY